MALTEKSVEVWEEISGIPLTDAPNLDASEHVGLLTVIAGVRQVAFFLDVPDSEIKKLIRLLGQTHLISFVGEGQSQHAPGTHPRYLTRGNDANHLSFVPDQEKWNLLSRPLRQFRQVPALRVPADGGYGYTS